MDRRVRLLERAAQEGDAEAQAALLRARVRTGELPAWRVKVAALLDHPGAMLLRPESKAPRAEAAVERFSSGGKMHAVTNPTHACRAAYCGRLLSAKPSDTSRGVPSCVACLRSELWRRDVQRSLIRFVSMIHDENCLAAFRACVAMVEEAYPPGSIKPGSVAVDPGLVQRLAKLAHWGVTQDKALLPESFGAADPYDPAGIYSHGLSSWVYNLTEAAWSIQRRGAMSSRQLERLASDTSQWVTGVSEGFQRLTELAANVRVRLLPWLLDGADPMSVYAEFLGCA